MNGYFPTDFAMRLAHHTELYPEGDVEVFAEDLYHHKAKKRVKAEKLYAQHTRLESFQNLSIAGTFKEAMISYQGFCLSKKQKKVLKNIHTSTGTWAKGKLVDKVISQLSDSKSGREVKELADIMIRVLGMDALEGGGSTQALEAYVITRNPKK